MFAGVAVATPMKLWCGKCENNLTRAAHPFPPLPPATFSTCRVRTGKVADPAALAAALRGVVGVVEHGLFVGMASKVRQRASGGGGGRARGVRGASVAGG